MLFTLIRWLPFATMMVIIVLRPSPLGVILAIVVGIAYGSLLPRFFPRFSSPDARGRISKLTSIAPTHKAFHGYAGKADRQVGGFGEIAMGGPIYWTLLLRDGAILDGVCSDAYDLDDGRLRIALQQRRYGKPLLVYDVDAQRIYTIAEEYRGLTPEALMDQALADPLRDGSRVREACRDAGEFVELNTVHGLRLDKEYCTAPPAQLAHSLRNGRLLEARLLLPPDLRGADYPGQWLPDPPYQLMLDGRDTKLHVDTLDEVWESPDGGCFVLKGIQLDGKRVINGLWHAWYGGAWHVLDDSVLVLDPENGSGRPFYLGYPEVGDDGMLRFLIESFSYGPEGRFPSKLAPPTVDLTVGWQPLPLSLQTENNYIAFKLPAGRGGKKR
jgi:hypothetical protein